MGRLFDVVLLTTIVLVVSELAGLVNLGWWVVTSLLWTPLLATVIVLLVFRIVDPVGYKERYTK
jgi:hypothetical protein